MLLDEGGRCFEVRFCAFHIHFGAAPLFAEVEAWNKLRYCCLEASGSTFFIGSDDSENILRISVKAVKSVAITDVTPGDSN